MGGAPSHGWLGLKTFRRRRDGRTIYAVERRDGTGAWGEEGLYASLDEAGRAIDEFVAEGHGQTGEYRITEVGTIK
jgi:hypothetical protein